MNEVIQSFSNIYKKMAIGVMLAVITSIILSVSVLNSLLYDYFNTQLRNQVYSTLSGLDWAVAEFLDKNDFDSIQRLTENIGADDYIDTIRVYDNSGKILSSNKRSEIGKEISENTVNEIFSGNKLKSVESDINKNIFKVSIPVRGSAYSSTFKSDIAGSIFIKLNLDSFKILLYEYKKLFWGRHLAVGLALFISILILLGTKMFFPLKKLLTAAREISYGNYTHQITYLHDEDFSPIIDEFNRMISQINTRDIILKDMQKKLAEQNVNLEKTVEERTRELKLAQDVTIESLAALGEKRDNETGYHIHRTKHYVKLLAEHLREHPRFTSFLNDENIDLIVRSTPLHDIGKIGVPDSILLNPGKLTQEEFNEMKKHTIYGNGALVKAEIIAGTTSFLKFAKEISYSHHEKWDGSGYPEGLIGEEIPISARLMAIADVYDALVSRRRYKPAICHEEAFLIITEGDGRTSPTHFDPDILQAFIELQYEFKNIFLTFQDV